MSFSVSSSKSKSSTKDDANRGRTLDTQQDYDRYRELRTLDYRIGAELWYAFDRLAHEVHARLGTHIFYVPNAWLTEAHGNGRQRFYSIRGAPRMLVTRLDHARYSPAQVQQLLWEALEAVNGPLRQLGAEAEIYNAHRGPNDIYRRPFRPVEFWESMHSIGVLTQDEQRYMRLARSRDTRRHLLDHAGVGVWMPNTFEGEPMLPSLQRSQSNRARGASARGQRPSSATRREVEVRWNRKGGQFTRKKN